MGMPAESSASWTSSPKGYGAHGSGSIPLTPGGAADKLLLIERTAIPGGCTRARARSAGGACHRCGGAAEPLARAGTLPRPHGQAPMEGDHGVYLSDDGDVLGIRLRHLEGAVHGAAQPRPHAALDGALYPAVHAEGLQFAPRSLRVRDHHDEHVLRVVPTLHLHHASHHRRGPQVDRDVQRNSRRCSGRTASPSTMHSRRWPTRAAQPRRASSS